MNVVVVSKTTFAMYQYTAKSITFNDANFVVVDSSNNSHTYTYSGYMVQVLV